jgi:hypothetical protein
MNLIEECRDLLAEASIESRTMLMREPGHLVFESNTILGFVFVYSTATELFSCWERDAALAIESYQLPLRRAGRKAWNTYVILLAASEATHVEAVKLSSLEEDLRGTRKIARAGVKDAEQMRIALLQLLPIQNSPRLESVDMASEIRLRTTELPAHLVDAFLSGADENVVAQVFESQS